MADENYIKIPTYILDDPNLTLYERTILVFIARKTIGFNKKSDGISFSQFVKGTGISKAKVIRTISDLHKKRFLKVVSNRKTNGAYSYNRYSLTLVSVRDKGSVCERQGVVSVRDKQYNNITILEREGTFFSFTEQELNRFVEHLKLTEQVNKPLAFKNKIRSQLEKGDSGTVSTFGEWKTTEATKQQAEEFRKTVIGKYGSVTTKAGEMSGKIAYLEENDGDFFLSIISDDDSHKRVRFETIEQIYSAVHIKTQKKETA